MKRIKAACLQQTIHFMLKDDWAHDAALKAVKDEVVRYKAQLNRSRTKYRIINEAVQPDGSVVIEIKKQVNAYSCGDYLA